MSEMQQIFYMELDIEDYKKLGREGQLDNFDLGLPLKIILVEYKKDVQKKKTRIG